MLITGISSGFHDAAWCYLEDQEILEAHHSERHTRIKNDPNLPAKGILVGKTAYYEKPFKKNVRRWLYGHPTMSKPYFRVDKYIDHHWSHAAASYYTRPFNQEPVCVVIDAIGEWDTASIWYNKKKKWSMKYPKSLGLFYSAMTDYIGLKPNEDEYIMMGMAAYGENPVDLSEFLQYNLHRGCRGANISDQHTEEDIALGAQSLLEKEVIKIMKRARKYSSHLCYGGGVALNCVANSKFYYMFDDVWIFPNPGDAGGALGAAAAYNNKRLNYTDCYLGTEIDRDVNPKEVVNYLLNHSYCGIANGRAEFGPRALGNRSLIADPRLDIKDTVNQIKRRQKFRPFAPAIMEEWAEQYFTGPMNEYMQYVSIANHDFHSVTHVDGTARVQVVKKDCKSILRPILEEWYEKTRCPMLLNTSLNIKGQPIVDNISDADEFERKYNVRVF